MIRTPVSRTDAQVEHKYQILSAALLKSLYIHILTNGQLDNWTIGQMSKLQKEPLVVKVPQWDESIYFQFWPPHTQVHS